MSKFYQDHNVKLRAANQVYKAGRAQRYDPERRTFALKLARIVAAGKSIIYVDESAFHSWTTQSKSWCTATKPNTHPINNARYAVTCYGAIGNCLKNGFVYTLGKSTNRDEFCAFLNEVKRNLRDPQEKPLLLYDGAPAHTARASTQLIKDLFTPLKNVPHSCGFNCKYSASLVYVLYVMIAIEHLWSAAKSHHKKLLNINAGRELSYEDHIDVVKRALALIPRHAITGLITSNRRYIR